MYRCESCGKLIADDEKHLGLCPNCSRDSLKEVVVICPICHKRLDGSRVDMNRIRWVCSHPKYDIKVYLESRE